MKKILMGLFFIGLTGSTFASSCGIKIIGLPISSTAEVLFINKGFYIAENENIARFTFESDCGFDGGRCMDLSILDYKGRKLQEAHAINYNGNEPWENLLETLLNKIENCHH